MTTCETINKEKQTGRRDEEEKGASEGSTGVFKR